MQCLKGFIFILFFLLYQVSFGQQTKEKESAHQGLIKGFKSPPLQSRPKALWPWVNGNFSLSQITHEMEEAKQKGMAGFDIWDVGTNMNPGNIVPDGPPFLGDESLHGIAHAIREGDRLGLEMGLISSSSWNAGGTWVKPEHGAMGLFSADTIVQGPVRFSALLPFPDIPSRYDDRREMILYKDAKTGLPVYYREIAVLAHPYSTDSVIEAKDKIISLKFTTSSSTNIDWEVPAGKWRIVRYVCAPTGQPLMVPSPKSNGLMLDHFSAEAQEANMQYVLQRLKSVLGSLQNRSLKYLYEDSYEVNSAVWTPSLPEAFQKSRGYGLENYLPVLEGFTLSDKNVMERFQFDFSKVLSDLIITNHYQKGTSMAKKEGLGFYAEAGGPGKPIHNVPFEDLKALGALTVPRGEFWNKHPLLPLLQIVKGISSAAHIYNQTYVEAEAFTSVWLWQEGPGELKPLADRAMCEGLNRFVYHTFPHSPPESGEPGWIYNFGTLINTTNGWWPKSNGFHEYLARCSYLLQQGNFIGDVAFYYGDKAPNFVSMKKVQEGLGEGYDYDVVNTDAILHKMSVKNGKIYLPHGQYYEVLVLPNEKKMDPAVLKKIREMVSAGAIVIGPKPTHSYSLKNHTENDRTINEIANQLWGACDSVHIQENKFGKGKVVWGRSVRDVLTDKRVWPDFSFNRNAVDDSLDFIHRRTGESDIYFVRNMRKSAINTVARFRVNKVIPSLWVPETGDIFPIDFFEESEKGIDIPLTLGPDGSFFILFEKPETTSALKGKGSLKTIAGKEIMYTAKGMATASKDQSIAVKGPWEIRFQHKSGTPVKAVMDKLDSWHLSTDSSVKYFTGNANYKTSFEIGSDQLTGNKSFMLKLNHVKEIAEVYLNGKKLGYYWHPSQSFDISSDLVAGKNYLTVEVVNSINNGLIGDALKPEAYRYYRSNITKLSNAWMTPFAQAPLIEAGLLGPVSITVYERK